MHAKKKKSEKSEIVFRYVKLLSHVIIALVISIIPVSFIDKAIKEAKIKSDLMQMYERIVVQENTENKRDLLEYLLSLDPGNTIITKHLDNVNSNIDMKKQEIKSKSDEIALVEKKIELLSKSSNEDKGIVNRLIADKNKLILEKQNLQNSLKMESEKIMSIINDVEKFHNKLRKQITLNDKDSITYIMETSKLRLRLRLIYILTLAGSDDQFVGNQTGDSMQ
jgi:hypothetical protein